MTPLEGLTQAAIRELASHESFSRGVAYFEEGAVLEATRRGDEIRAEVQGSDYEPYLVTVRVQDGGVAGTSCTCPYSYGGACKHAVAALLTLLKAPETVEERPPLEELLARLDREQLQELLLSVADRFREAASLIEARAESLKASAAVSPAPAPAGTPSPARPAAAINPAPFRKQVRALFRRGGRYDDDYGLGAISGELADVIEEARPHVEAGHGLDAMLILEAVADEFLDGFEEVDDSDGEGADVMADLGRLMTEAALAAELTPEERADWKQRLDRLIRRAADYGLEGELPAARLAVEQGWDYPPLLEVLRGERDSLFVPAVEAEADEEEEECEEEHDEEEEYDEEYDEAYGDAEQVLAAARLNVLERQGRLEECLRLARAAGLAEQYVTLLIRQGRIEEAVREGLARLGTRREALAVARALQEAGAGEEALRIGEHGLSLPRQPEYYHSPFGGFDGGLLPEWVRDLAASLGQPERAVEPAVAAFKERPGLENYLAAEKVAGGRWPELRGELLAHAREKLGYFYDARVDILLHEGLLEEAMAAADEAGGHAVVEKVADAVLQSHPDWVFRACAHQFDRIADAGKSTYYREAAEWLRKAREALRIAGREREWNRYLDEVLARHGRKYTLVPLLKPLRL
jgi:uncharacterized Zn finger protein